MAGSRVGPTLEDLSRGEKIEYSVLRDITYNFSPGQKIGQGGYAVVYKGEVRDGFIAVKELNSVIDYGKFRGEVECLRSIKHSNIVRYLGYCAEEYQQLVPYGGKDDWARHPHQLICFEYLHNGSLDEHLTGEGESEPEPCGLEWCVCYKIIQGICLGLQYLHEQEPTIIHRDIKPGNILLDIDMTPKIADFGLSRFLVDGQSHVMTRNEGTWKYMAPELRDAESSRVEFTLKSDIFSLGALISRMVKGFRMASEEETVLEWSRRLNQLDASEKLTALEQVRACIDVSVKCLDKEAANRPSIQDIVRQLHATTDCSAARNNSPALPLLAGNAKQATKEPEVPPGPSSSTPANGLGDTRPDKVLLELEFPSWFKVYFLAVTGDVPLRDLAAGASYQVYLVYKLAPGATGLRGGAVLTSSLRLYGERIVDTSKVSLDPAVARRVRGVTYPVARSNGWLEIKLAQFDNEGEMLREKAVIVDLREENDTIMKSGLIIECMEFRSPAGRHAM